MIIVIDGADGVGKSTTIQELRKLLPNSTVINPQFDHTKYPTLESAIEFELKKLRIAKELDTMYSYVFVDRSVFTTIIYEEVFSGNITNWDTRVNILTKYTLLVNKTIILCVNNPKILMQRIKRRRKIKKIDKKFENSMVKLAAANEKFSKTVVSYAAHFSTDTIKRKLLIKKILKYINGGKV
jgi:thymidylate kinase